MGFLLFVACCVQCVVDTLDGEVELGGCGVRALLQEHGSPLYMYCEETVENACRDFRNAFEPGSF